MTQPCREKLELNSQGKWKKLFCILMYYYIQGSAYLPSTMFKGSFWNRNEVGNANGRRVGYVWVLRSGGPRKPPLGPS